jgi:hypothetical protein
MSNARTISNARLFLRQGQGVAYARILSGSIRAALSARSDREFRKAIADDKAEAFFVDLNTRLPRAKEPTHD